jgi:hypothetical protein
MKNDMAIKLPSFCYERTLVSTSELIRLLNVPESRMFRALREGVICPIGMVGRVTLIAMMDDELEAWRVHFHGSQS